MFSKKIFIFYLPKINKFKVVKARDESYAFHVLCKTYCNYPRTDVLDDVRIINYDLIK